MTLSEISKLFDQAVTIADPRARMEFVESACPNEADRAKLNRLLVADAQTCQIMDQPEAAVRIAENLQSVSGNPQSEVCPVRVGDRIDNYKLLQNIGEGGMGSIFMAEQLEPIQRRVAIKIIKTAHSSRQILARFEAERSALSRLEHPNITRIFDAGTTESGLPYFVMELVRGDSMVEYCDRHKLSVSRRVELLEQACLAVHHAHQKGIIHRDIKPTNIMITMHDGRPISKVIDFGIAKALDRPLIEDTLFTRYGDMVGTPQYMSPEQAEKSGLDLDVRTDIYSLGAVLFELLTGSPPIEFTSLEGKGVLGVLETIRDNETESPSVRATKFMSLDDTVASRRSTDGKQLPRLLRGELDWITLKSLARDRSQRYESAAAMAKDLRAYLNGDTVDAAAPTFLYQARKLFQRHKTAGMLMLSWALMMIALTVFSAFWAVSNNRLRELATGRAEQLSLETQRLQESLVRERHATQRAQKAERQALSLVNEKKEQAAIGRAVRQHMTELLMSSESPFESVMKLGQFSNPESASVAELLRKAIDQIDQGEIDDGLADTSEIKPSPLKALNAKLGEKLKKVGYDRNSIDRGLAAMPPEVFTTLFPQPNKLSNMLIEQFRREFGAEHPRVAAALLHSCRVGETSDQFESEVMESRLRESLAILSGAIQPQDIAVRIETKLMLSQTVKKLGRDADALQQLEAAKNELNAAESQLDRETLQRLRQVCQRVESTL